MKRSIPTRSMLTAQHAGNHEYPKQQESSVKSSSFCAFVEPEQEDGGQPMLNDTEILQLVQRHRILSQEMLRVRSRLYRLGVNPETFK